MFGAETTGLPLEVCVCVCVCARMRAYMHVYVRGGVRYGLGWVDRQVLRLYHPGD